MKFLFSEEYKFSVMWKDTKTVDVCIDKDTVTVKKYVLDVVENPFYGGPVDLERVYDFLCSRLMDPNRPCLQEYLDFYGVDEFNPYILVKKTHGVMWEDFLWLRFPDEDIAWKDVKIRG